MEENKNEFKNNYGKNFFNFEKISLNLYNFITKVSSYREIYEKIRSITLDSKPYYNFTSNKLNKLFDNIDEILKYAID